MVGRIIEQDIVCDAIPAKLSVLDHRFYTRVGLGGGAVAPVGEPSGEF
jgi:hypothetical protein